MPCDLDDGGYAGLTRVPIDFHKKNFQKKMDCRQRRQVYVVCARQTTMPGNDGRGIYAALAGGSASTE
jgi:hypothetical protein